jgi:hypothetical protein
MARQNIATFAGSAYEILDERLAETGDVVIWSVDPLTPRLGDRFTIESNGQIHDVEVYALTTFRGGWSVTCRAGALDDELPQA